MSDKKKRSLPSPAILALGALGSAYGLRRALAYIGKRRMMAHLDHDASSWAASRAIRKMRARSHPAISKAYEKVYLRSR